MTLERHDILGSHYGFSATRLDELGAAEYTLVTIVADKSGSVGGFAKEIERCIAEVARACRQSPRADNLLLRVTAFDNHVEEIHGFKPLSSVASDDYDGAVAIGGSTALHDAAHNAVASMKSYGKSLTAGDFEVNGIIVVITDGADNASSTQASDVADAVAAVRGEEALESLLTILVGVEVPGTVSTILADFQKQAGFDRYLELGKADAKSLAKLADFVSRSIGAQSRALGTGQSGAPLVF
ncbi:MAG: hypothetical protein KC731_33780 [Myxococcales bacterium]|nr:hypothetical protein [Myxococcales bacterium]